MPLSPDQAAQNLREIEETSRRSASVQSYAYASPFFLLWGVIWFLGYGGTAYLPDAGSIYLWGALNLAGILGSMWIGSRLPAGSGRAQSKFRFVGTFVTIGIFIAGAELVMKPTTGEQQGAFAALLVALFYGLMGIWQGARFLIAGVVVAALTLGGFYFLHDHFFSWMAVVGGGALVLAGLWLRTV